MRRTNGVYWIAVCLVVILVIGSAISAPDFYDDASRLSAGVSEPEKGNLSVAGIPHAPIAIDGDANFTLTASNEGWDGNGSSQNPFIIDGLEIDRGGAGAHCISINNTRVNFTISNCSVMNTVSPGFGIYLYNVTYCQLTNNDVSNCYLGIRLTDCSSNVLLNNTCNNNQYGIYIYTSNSIFIVNNTCLNNINSGIYLHGSSFNTVFNNTINFTTYDSMGLNGANSNTITYNTIYGSYLVTDEGIWLEGSSSSNTISNNTISTCQHAVSIPSGTGNVVSWNVFLDIWDEWARDGGSNFNYNYWEDYTGVDENEDGFGDTPRIGYYVNDYFPLMYIPTPPRWIETPTDQTITDLELLYYDLNATAPAPLYWTLNDTLNFMIDGDGILEPIGTLPIGTYGLYVEVANIYGSKISVTITIEVVPWDTSAPSWQTIPDNQVIEYGIAFSYDANATDPSGLDTWWLNRTDFSIDADGVIVNATNLSVQIYSLELSVNDTYGNVQSISITVTVEDTTSPIWITTPTNQIVEFGSIFAYDLDAFDLSGIHHYEINDTKYKIDGNGLIQNNTVLSVGEYWIDVRAYDQYDQYCSEIIVVSVRDTTAPIWIIMPIDVIMNEGEQLEYALFSWDLSGVHWEANDTVNFGITSDGRVFNLHNLAPGAYGILVSVYDEYNNILSDAFTVYVRDLGLASTTTTSTITTIDGIESVMIFLLGTGLGGVVVVVVIVIISRRKS